MTFEHEMGGHEMVKTETMRGVIQREYGGPETMLFSDAQPVPTPGPGEVRIRVHGSSVAAGDVYMMTGRPYLMRLFGFGLFAPKDGRPGLDVAGVVDAIGEGVSRLAVGDRVYGELTRGSFAEYVVGAEELLTKMPETLSSLEAAAIPTSGMTALQAVRQHGQVAAGERVLVIGATGGVGHFALQVAVADGARVDAVCSAANAELARELGANRVIDYRAEDIAERVATYDVVIDTAGTLPLEAARAMLRPGGRWVAVSAGRGGDVLGPIPRMLAMNFGNLGKDTRFVTFVTAPSGESLAEITELVERGALRPVIQQSYELAEVPRALADQSAGGARGKRVIIVQPGT